MTDNQAIIFAGAAAFIIVLQFVQVRYLHRIRRRLQRRLP